MIDDASLHDKRDRAVILVVEQDRHVRSLERFFLERAGFYVEFAEDGEAALSLARKRRPAVMVSEILVPGLDGLSVCRALKSDPETKEVSILIFSILAAEARAREAGADGFLRKPLDDKLLIDAIEKLI